MKSPKGKGKKKLVKRIKREANMAVAFAPVQINPSEPRKDSRPMKVWIVRVWEIDPPEGQERLEWILITNEPVECFEAAYRVVGWYECRWIIEEYHKGMKTGCRTEALQFTSEDRLQPAIALLSVVTLTLLQLRQASRRSDAHTRKATTIIGSSYVEVLCARTSAIGWFVPPSRRSRCRRGNRLGLRFWFAPILPRELDDERI